MDYSEVLVWKGFRSNSVRQGIEKNDAPNDALFI
jgi:hypothetical protein